MLSFVTCAEITRLDPFTMVPSGLSATTEGDTLRVPNWGTWLETEQPSDTLQSFTTVVGPTNEFDLPSLARMAMKVMYCVPPAAENSSAPGGTGVPPGMLPTQLSALGEVAPVGVSVTGAAAPPVPLFAVGSTAVKEART